MLETTRVVLAQSMIRRLARQPRKGFTLIELLVVVVIIGILASIALPSFIGAQDKARNASVVANVGTVKMALEQFAVDNNGNFPVPQSVWAAATGTAGIRQNNYLPGNRLPKAPWGGGEQQVTLATAAPMAAANAIATGGSFAPDNTRFGNANAGSVPPGVGTAQRPTASLHFGAMMYDYDVNAQTYVLYGTGKRNRDAVQAAKASNGG
jgi:general secretion pathway protein G